MNPTTRIAYVYASTCLAVLVLQTIFLVIPDVQSTIKEINQAIVLSPLFVTFVVWSLSLLFGSKE